MSAIRYINLAVVLSVVCAMVGCGSTTNIPAGSTAPPPAPAQAPPQLRTYDYTHKVLAKAKRYAGQHWTVAILRFGDTRQIEDVPFGEETTKETTDSGQVNVRLNVVGQQINAARSVQTPPQMNKRAREILKHALVESEAFAVVERERILEILREINFGKTGYVDPATSPEEGQLLCVRYLIEGSLGVNEDRTLKETLDAKEDYRDMSDYEPGVLDNVFRPARSRREKRLLALRELRKRRLQNSAQRKFGVACYLSAYEVQTGEVKTSVMGLGTNGLEAINDAVEELIDALIDKDDGVRVAAVLEDTVYLDIGSKGGIRVGDRFQLVHLGTQIRNRHGQIIGREETEVGEIEISETRELMSIGKIVNKAGEIKRGDLATPAKH